MSWLTKQGFEQSQEQRAQDWVAGEVLDDTTLVLEQARCLAEAEGAAAERACRLAVVDAREMSRCRGGAAAPASIRARVYDRRRGDHKKQRRWTS